MMKKFLSLAVAALLTISAVATSATAAKFTDVDVKNDALNDAVELLTALNVTKGTSDTTFGTDENVTRQQMAAFIYRMMKAGKSVEGGTNTTSFTDLDDSTFFFMISWASSNGIIKGRSATEFDPKGGIVLQDAYTMIVRALGYDDGTLAYPIGYISLAEDLGLDENLPSTLGYADTLTRGDVAIILANMFYAETAEVEIVYESEPVVYCPVHKYNTGACDGEDYCNPTVVSGAQTPKEVRKTVAEKVFEVEKISQRVVATPNYSFDNNVLSETDVEMIMLSKDYVDDYADYKKQIPSLNEIEFAELGLEGSADDYFLSDIVMFVREADKKGDYEVFGATATGTKKTVSFADVEFGTVPGTAAEKYYDGENKEYKKISGKLTIDGDVTYLFDAPYSFAKNPDDYDIYNAEFITLGAYNDGRDVEEGVVDVNFNYELLDSYADDSVIGEYTEIEADNPDTEDVDETVMGWKNTGYLSQIYFGGEGEIDVYDCNGDGKPEYLFVKDFAVATIDTEEDGRIFDTAVDFTGSVKEAKLLTDKSIVEGAEFANKNIVLAYANSAANYIKVAEVLKGVNASVTSTSNENFTLATGEKVFFENAKYVVSNGDITLASIDDVTPSSAKEATYYFSSNGTLVYADGIDAAINVNENWVVVLSENVYEAPSMVDGKLTRDAYIDIYNDGEVKSVKAKKITEGKDVDGDEFFETPKTYTKDTDTYDYTDYVSKLATGKADKNGAYYFQLVDFNKHNTLSDLADKEEVANEYRKSYVGTETEIGFYQLSGNIFELTDLKKDDLDAEKPYINGVYVKDYTKIIIKSQDSNGEDVYSVYGIDNLPDIDKSTKFSNVSYVLINNVNSTKYENLVVFYGELDDELKGDAGAVADVRIVKGSTLNATEDGSVRVYSVFNPFEGNIVTDIEGDIEQEENPVTFVLGDIVGLTTNGFVDNSVDAVAGNVFTEGSIYNVDSDTKFEDTTGLGYVEITEYDETTGYLFLDGADAIFQVTDETVVTFLDKSAQTITTVDSAILGSTSTTYRWNSAKAKDQNLTAFVCVEEDDDADEDLGTFYNVKFAVIVRD